MDFSMEYEPQDELFAQEVREWIKENIPKEYHLFRDAYSITPEQWEIRREIARRLGKKRWLLPGYPYEYGGCDMDVSHMVVLKREFEKARIAHPPHYDSAVSLGAPAILATGTEEQKKRFLPPVLAGEVHTWQLFTEPEAGTDEANQQTNALRHERDKEYFVINGQKMFVGCWRGKPDYFLLLTRSDLQAPRHQNLAMFMCPANLPGITITKLDLYCADYVHSIQNVISDNAPGQKNQVFFDDVRVHQDYLIGGDHDGWKVAEATLLVEHGTAGPRDVRTPPENYVLPKFIEECSNNPDIAARIRENPLLMDNVASYYISNQVGRLWQIRNFWQQTNMVRAPGRGPQLTLYQKYFGPAAAMNLARVLGPYALIQDDERALLGGSYEALIRGSSLLAPSGTPEAQKIIMARSLGIGR
ncbi:MAG: acyl-CoA dehydrogenase family protein [Dehalococcoidia bacterium]|nr:acyl-CoA dehydrogenase family protein [Dehalococcoidia bacterium]